MSSIIVFFLLFLLQFFYFPVGVSFFEGAKVYLAEILIFVLFLLQIISKEGITSANNKKTFIWSGIALFGITIFHVLFHQTQTLLFGNGFRLQGTFLLWMLFAFAVLSSRIAIETKIKPFFITLVLLVQLVCTLLFIGVGADRPVGTMGEPNALAASVLFLWPFLLFSWPNSLKMKILTSAGLLFVFTILFVSGSRSGFIALGVQVSFIMIKWFLESFLYKNHKTKRILFYSTVISLIIFLVSYVTPFMGPRTEYEDRGEIWKAAAHVGLSHPLLGVGFGNAEYEYHKANIALGNKLTGYYVDSAHNIFLDWFVQAGIAGLAIFLFLLFQSFKLFIQKGQTRNIVLLLGIITALSFNPASVVSLTSLWWLIGQGSKY